MRIPTNLRLDVICRLAYEFLRLAFIVLIASHSVLVKISAVALFSFGFPFFPLVSHVVKFSFFCLEVIAFFFASVVEDYRCMSCFYCSFHLTVLHVADSTKLQCRLFKQMTFE